MIKFSKEKVLLLHKLIAEETGGSIGVRDEALLESALENVFSGFGGQEFYPTKEEKGARLGYALISNHAFVDGNKRIGMYVMLTFLEVNGIRLDCTNDEVVEVGLAVASGAPDGNNGKSAERMVAKSTNRSRNDSDLCLRLPHNPEVGGSSPPPATILSDQNRYTHLKPLRNQGFHRFYGSFFQSVFYRYTKPIKSVRQDLN